MTKGSDVLSSYPPTSRAGGHKARAYCGGVEMENVKDVNAYAPPQGPIGIMGNNRPGLGGTNHGNCGTQGKR